VDEKRREAFRARADDIADRQNEFGPGRPDGAKRRPRRPLGNSRQALLRRLRRDHPELHRLVLDGTLSPFRAAVAAGFRRKPGPRPKRPIDPLEEGHHEQMLELWLGPSHRGSVFNNAAELRAAWVKHRDQIMAWWGTNCRRPAGWWELETDLEYPGYDAEPRFLYERGLLTAAENAQFEQSQKKEPSNAIAEGPESA
jgi:hypothetical protein